MYASPARLCLLAKSQKTANISTVQVSVRRKRSFDMVRRTFEESPVPRSLSADIARVRLIVNVSRSAFEVAWVVGNRDWVKDGFVADLETLDLGPGRLGSNIYAVCNVLFVLFDVVWHAIVPRQRSKHRSGSGGLRLLKGGGSYTAVITMRHQLSLRV